MSAPLNVIFLWHMHQPYYKDPVKNEYVLPWTYLHGVKDYFDMPAIVEDTPGARAVFNLVPSLLEQLLDYATGQAVDPFLIKGAMNPADMTEEDRVFLLENFFSANRQRMIEPHRRYLELLYMAGEGKPGSARERVRHFSNQDLLDLQVCFFLAWTGEAARRRFPEFRELLAKGSGYTARDRDLLFATQREVLNRIIPLYQALHRSGQVELSVTPYYHPILPLLCDNRIAQEAMPRVTLPQERFRHPEDARAQIRRGVRYFKDVLGIEPHGMWPSEGSVSDEALAIIAECGLSWAATDEEVLARSLDGGLGNHKEKLYRPWTFAAPQGELGIFFRDHQLSDLIGFTYSQWDARRAAADFTGRLRQIHRHLGGDDGVVPIILDGENAWEFYPDNGYEFLSTLYTGIAEAGDLQLTTCSEALSLVRPAARLHHIHPGSWINATYGIWIGHPEENLAWDQLARARLALEQHHPRAAELLAHAGENGDPQARLLCTSLYAAEGSDWFWWFGDDHFSPHSDRFDYLFRRHLTNLYRSLELDPPRELLEPIKKKSPAGLVREPAAFIEPEVNGLVGDYFEWLAAGLFDLTRQGSAMHSSDRMLQGFYWGYNREHLFCRIDGIQDLARLLKEMDILALHLISDREYRLPMQRDCREGMLLTKEAGSWVPTNTCCRWAIRRTAEVALPLAGLNLIPGAKLFVSITLTRDNEEIGRWPSDAPLMLEYVGPELEADDWLI
ncbi:glycoside hydrolase family 57 protein [Trichlorobacter ammonificans]|uniref:Glycoside hydrolase family 57 n=1 Tax=Trichlorobacter ammonificans TaxID=2916410 RepID=A0ABN8HBC3_9BACT|nr:glycoside hydrolase family 57 protein [Trichlorobacter ammonificans]CAH2029919.1 Glycoside hydrolase family 57 [Trichlorobacter ammonificans]